MLKASKFVTFCEAMIGQAYWYGTYGNKCTKELAKKKADQFPKYYAEYTTEELQDAIDKKKVCFDCVGLVKSFFWSNGGDGVIAYVNGTGDFTTTYQSNGVPDVSANNLFEWCKKQGAEYGKISTIPNVPGILVFKSGHVGVYKGNGRVVEAMGHNYGVVETELKKRSWTAWSYLPSWVIEYDTKKNGLMQNIWHGVTNIVTSNKVNSYQKGDMGQKIAKIQKMLTACGYLLNANGTFDDATELVLCAFQLDHGLKADGVYGKETHEVLMKVYKNIKADVQTSVTQQKDKIVKVTGSRVNIRQEPDLSAKSIGVAKRNAKLAYDGETTDGWHKVVYKKQVGWISADYSEIV